MRYHARLETDESLERPIECFGNSLATMEDWGRKILCAHPSGKISITERQETLVRYMSAESSPVNGG